VGAFGEKLRKQREQRGIELDAISNTTKISTRMLRALEDERFDQLPGGVFNKGFVRAYARQVGLDEEEAVADYLAALNAGQAQQQSLLQEVRSPAAKPSPVAAPEPGDNARSSSEVVADNVVADKNDNNVGHNHANAPAPRQEDRRKQGRRNVDRRNEDRRNEDRRNIDRLRRKKFQKYPAGDPAPSADESSLPVPWGKLAMTLAFVTLVLAFWNFRRQAQPAPTSQRASFSTQSPAPASAPASAANQPSSASSPMPAAASPVGTLSPEKLSPTIPAGTSSPHTEPTSSATSPIPSATNATSEPAAEPDANPPAPKSTATVAATKPPATFTLLIRAEKSTWISLIADGKPVAQETLIAPAHTSVRATREIVVKAGNAAGVSFMLNGKEIPAQGNEGEVKTFIFEATGLRTQ
jgi:cytoskeletal protein RodZ